MVDVIVNGNECTNLTIFINQSGIRCNVGPGVGGPYSATLTVNTQSITRDIFYYSGMYNLLY